MPITLPLVPIGLLATISAPSACPPSIVESEVFEVFEAFAAFPTGRARGRLGLCAKSYQVYKCKRHDNLQYCGELHVKIPSQDYKCHFHNILTVRSHPASSFKLRHASELTNYLLSAKDPVLCRCARLRHRGDGGFQRVKKIEGGGVPSSR
jgi:hypothetical protein